MNEGLGELRVSQTLFYEKYRKGDLFNLLTISYLKER